ncbi:DUF4870 domain-containing protein [Halobacillus aidingensis]|uniref:Uncharacterized membrane protein n=1 Tax=Halobacillus aidingensis TaxID=240303 RepID=A0A1H0ICX8_HALAD|nr:DUF4870 domain-containing protein [Halobacillus aidingensis]SDO29242.1 Uncharacterized membrane protein [Halobacillus aidingensis]
MDQESKTKTSGSEEEKKSSTGLEENVGGLLAYLLGFISGIVFLLIEKENEFIRFHAMQSVILFGFFFVFGFVVNFIPIIGLFVSLLMAPVSLVLWILLMVKAYQGERYHLPVTGKMAEEQIQKMAK